MHFTCGLPDGNMREACSLYQKWFPGHRIPEQTTLIMIHQCLRDSGAFVVNWMGWGMLWPVSGPDLEERVLHHAEEEPGTSKRRTEAAERVSQNRAVRLLYIQLLHPYHLQWVQGLNPAQYPGIATFSWWHLQICATDPHLLFHCVYWQSRTYMRSHY
jgi:hypothetical protein